MDYEQKYRAALEWMRDVYPTLTGASKEDAEHFFPELAESAESEDEKIRKEILDFIQLCLSRTDFGSRSIALRKEDAEMFEKWIAYLEKHKEQKQSEMEKEYVRTLHSLIADFLRGKQEIDREYYQKIWDWLDNRHIEQKPAEWSDSFEENIRILLHDKLTWHSEDGKTSSTVFIDDKTLKDIISGIWFYVGKEAIKYPNKELKTAELSEEDETVMDIDLIQKSWYRQGYIDGINKQEPQWILENLRYKENPKYGQPLETVTDCHQLEEAARNSWFNYEFDCGALYSKCYKDGFKAGAGWQREQFHDACYQCEKNYDNVFFKGEQHAIKMLKEEAIEGKCVDVGNAGAVIDTDYGCLFLPPESFKVDDMVKVIILNDE